MKDKIVLNPEQKLAVNTLNGPVLVIAGAGSGKTRVLVKRTANLISKGVHPKEILLLTFTRKAATEMLSRIQKEYPSKTTVVGGTFHSFCLSFLRKYYGKIGLRKNAQVIDTEATMDILSTLKTMDEDIIDMPNSSSLVTKDIQKILSAANNRNLSIDALVRKYFSKFSIHIKTLEMLNGGYLKYKKEHNFIDFDDILSLSNTLLDNKNILDRLSTYKYIMVDEFQDTNVVQSEIVKKLSKKYGNIMVVGDDQQSIYGFRGAENKNILEFPKYYDDCKVIKLEQNYRSTPNIVDLTNAIAAYAKESISKVVFSKLPSKDKPAHVIFSNENDQSGYVIERISELINSGVKPHDISVLFRVNSSTTGVEIGLKQLNLKYVKFGGMDLFSYIHIKTFLSILKVIIYREDVISWIKVLSLKSGIGKATASKIIQKIIETDSYEGLLDNPKLKIDHLDFCEKLYKFIMSVRKETKTSEKKKILDMVYNFYFPYFKKAFGDDQKRMRDLESLIQSEKYFKNIIQYVTDLTLSKDTNEEIEGRVTLSTIHSAKGLEWDHVFLIDVQEGKLPSLMAKRPEEIEEERRLFYVATSRAKKTLTITSVNHSDFDKSRFITEITNFDTLVRVENRSNLIFGNREDF